MYSVNLVRSLHSLSDLLRWYDVRNKFLSHLYLYKLGTGEEYS